MADWVPPEVQKQQGDAGLLQPGNIDLKARPVVKNSDGSISTVRSMSFNEDGKEVLIPTVAVDGSRILSDQEAINQYRKTGQFLGKFATPDAATAYAQKLHEDQSKLYAPSGGTWRPPEADAGRPLAPSDPGFLQNAWNTVTSRLGRGEGILTGKPNVLSQSEAIGRPMQYRPGMKMGEMMAQAPDRMQNPMLFSMGPGNIGGGSVAAAARPPPSPGALQAAQRLQDFKAQGVTPNVPAIGQGRNVGLAANISRLAPFSPVTRRAQQNIEEVQNAAERAASGFGQAQTEAEAGKVAQNAMRRFATDKSQAKSDYGEFDRLMHGAAPMPMNSTLNLLRRIKGSYPTTPELEGILSHPTIQKLTGALEPRTVNVPAQTSGILNQFGQPAVTQPAQTIQRGGELSFPEAKRLRTQIGSMLETPQFRPDTPPRDQLRSLYGALTNDMYAGAKARGPAAVAALNKATMNFNQRMKLVDRLDSLTKANAPESVFYRLNRAATAGGGEDAKLLTMTKRVLSPDEWGDMGAAIIRRLGNPRPGQPRASGDPDFSIGSFATNWRKLTGDAKDQLFGKDTPNSSRAGLEQLARVAGDLQNVGRLANAPHSGEYFLLGSAVSATITAIATGQIGLAIGEAALPASAWSVGKVMMSPGFTEWLYKLPQTIRGSQTPGAASNIAMASLRAAVGGEAEEEVSKERRRVPPVPKLPPPPEMKFIPGDRP